MKTKQSLIFILLLISLGLTACRPFFVPRIRARFSLDKPFPERDIVFITESFYSTGDNLLGFIQSDGSGLEYVSLKNMSSDKGISLTPPTWSSDGKSIFSSTAGYSLPFVIHSDGVQYSLGSDIYEHVGANDAIYTSVISGTQQAIFAGHHSELKTNMVAILELDKDPVVLVSYPSSDSSADWRYLGIGPNPLCGQDTVLFAYNKPFDPDKERKMVFLNIGDGTQTSLSSEELGAEWFIFPSCSPDGKWVAYTTSDGIYLIRPDGTEKRLLEPIIESINDPAVSWSPDGKWIVYHHCKSEASCNMGDESDVAVYKMNIETGQKIKLVDGGLFPYWRWPLTEPAE